MDDPSKPTICSENLESVTHCKSCGQTFSWENLERRGPIRLGLIADLHGGLANDAASRLD